MKTLVASLILASTLMSQAQAMEVVAIVVGGSVSTVALSGTAAVLGGARFKAEAFQEALDTVASGDEANISPALEQIISDIRKANPELRDANDLELLEAIVNAELQ